MANKVIYYSIGKVSENTDIIQSDVSNNATIEKMRNHGDNPGNQSWQFLRILETPNSYHIKNHDGVYLCVNTLYAGAIVRGGDYQSNFTIWELEHIPSTPPESSKQYKIKITDTGTSFYMKISGNNVVLDVICGNASIWDIQVHPGLPLTTSIP